MAAPLENIGNVPVGPNLANLANQAYLNLHHPDPGARDIHEPISPNYHQLKQARCDFVQTMEVTNEEKNNARLILHVLEHRALGVAAAGKFAQNYSVIIIHLLLLYFLSSFVGVPGAPPAWAVHWTNAVNNQFRTINILLAVVRNSSAILMEHTLVAVPNANGVIPHWFPPTRGDLYNASENHLMQLLNFYNLPPQPPNGPGSIRLRRIALIAGAIGVRPL